MMNHISPATGTQKSSTSQTVAGPKGGVVPDGFASMMRIKTSVEGPVLPGDTTTAEIGLVPAALLEAFGVAEVPGMVLPEDGNLEQGPQASVILLAVGAPVPQQQMLETGRTQVALVQQPLVRADSVSAEAAQLIPVGKSGEAPIPAVPIAQPADQKPQTTMTQPVGSTPVPPQQVLETSRTQLAPVQQPLVRADSLSADAAQLVPVGKSGGAPIPAVPIAQPADQKPQIAITQPVGSTPVPPQQVLETSRTQVAPVQQPVVRADSLPAQAAQMVPAGKSDAAPPPARPIAQPIDMGVAELKIASVQAQTGQSRIEPDRLSVQTPENSNQALPKSSDVELVGKHLLTGAKAPGDLDIAKPVPGVKLAEASAIQIPKVQQPSLPVDTANTIVTATPAGSAGLLPVVSSRVAGIPQTQILLQVANVSKKRSADQGPLAITTALTVGVKPAGVGGEGSIVEPVEQGQQTAPRPATLIGIFAKSAVLVAQEKPASAMVNFAEGMGEPLDLLDRAQAAPGSVLTPDMTSAAARAILSQDATPKIAAKPFTEALMSQVKSVAASEGRTTVNLVPRGLGSIEVEVISEKDVASRVVVRVENPAVLQALRDDRNLLAQAIGVLDSSIFDFQEQGAEDQSGSRHNQNGQTSDLLGDAIAIQTQQQHLDVVHEGHLDIMT